MFSLNLCLRALFKIAFQDLQAAAPLRKEEAKAKSCRRIKLPGELSVFDISQGLQKYVDYLV
jgi:hypothetical protein